MQDCGDSLSAGLADLRYALALGSSRNGANSCVAIVDRSAPNQRVLASVEWTLASARMRPSIVFFKPSGVSDCGSRTAACTVASKFLLRCSASRAKVEIILTSLLLRLIRSAHIVPLRRPWILVRADLKTPMATSCRRIEDREGYYRAKAQSGADRNPRSGSRASKQKSSCQRAGGRQSFPGRHPEGPQTGYRRTHSGACERSLAVCRDAMDWRRVVDHRDARAFSLFR